MYLGRAYLNIMNSVSFLSASSSSSSSLKDRPAFTSCAFCISLLGYFKGRLAVMKWDCDNVKIIIISIIFPKWAIWSNCGECGGGGCAICYVSMGAPILPVWQGQVQIWGEQSIKDVIVQFLDLSKWKVWTCFSGWHHICPNLSKAGFLEQL